MIDLDPRSAALVLIDLQNGILARNLEPVASGTLIERGKALAERFRAAGAPVVLVNASPRGGDPRRVDEPSPIPKTLPPGFIDLVSGLAEAGDVLITKRGWGAFSNPDLDAELRHRGVRTIVLSGVATQFGLEQTARQACDLGYELVIVRDVTTSSATDVHDRTMRHVFPCIARLSDAAALSLQPA